MVMAGALRALAYLEEQLSKLAMEAQLSDLSGEGRLKGGVGYLRPRGLAGYQQRSAVTSQLKSRQKLTREIIRFP